MRSADRISTHEPITQLRYVTIKECDEPLVDFLEMCPLLLQAKPRWLYTREHLLRQSAAKKLCQAAENLPKGYRIAVIEGWRPPHIQRRMYAASWARWKEQLPDWKDSALRRLVNRFTAPPHSKVPPPHSTGGAMDIMLANEQGEELDMTSPYAQRDRRAYPFAAKGLSDIARKHRSILHEAFEGTAISNYPSEYWHWSYGDQGWAYRGSHPFAIYGAIRPPDYIPPPGDDTDEPLIWAQR